jgi:hypothetical protein
MQIAAHVLAYNVTSTLRAVLENMSPHVDKIYVAYPLRPWGYVPESRAAKLNPTSMADVLVAAKGLNVEVLEGDWETDEGSRNACLERAKDESFDWFLTQDADEFYTEHSWQMIRKQLIRSFHEESFVTTWYNFWKSAQYVVVNGRGDIKGTNAGFALRCKKDLFFERSRIPNTTRTLVMDCPCYHYGYVRTDAEIREKISTWMHAKDFNALRWYKHKWLNWTEDTINLHPTAPWIWKRAIRFPGEQPEFAIDFNLEYSTGEVRPLSQVLANAAYDNKVTMSQHLRQVKTAVRKFRRPSDH